MAFAPVYKCSSIIKMYMQPDLYIQMRKSNHNTFFAEGIHTQMQDKCRDIVISSNMTQPFPSDNFKTKTTEKHAWM